MRGMNFIGLVQLRVGVGMVKRKLSDNDAA